uniref:Uncharacterized protein n=1 Tax=Octopus bimaculoides TaxID=37653 RepID=A0A0L8HFM8_OCTBM
MVEVVRNDETANSVNNIGDGGDWKKLWVTLMGLVDGDDGGDCKKGNDVW